MAELFEKDMIVEFCKCKKVLHIGACDSPYHIDKTKNLGIEDIFYGDIIRDEYEIDLRKFGFDYIIFGDVAEHLENL